MAYKALMFGTDDLYPKLKPLYDAAVKNGTLEIVATVDKAGKLGEGAEDISNFDLAIISSLRHCYERMKLLESQGFRRSRIIDGRVFKVPNLDFPRLLAEGVAYGVFNSAASFQDTSSSIYPLVYKFKGTNTSTVKLGMKSYIAARAVIEGNGSLQIGKFSAIAWDDKFLFGLNNNHDYKKVSSFDVYWFDWEIPADFWIPKGNFQINVGSDVWIGRGCILKSANPKKPLVIGDGSIIASDSVVVKDIPPYAIVGGNPAQIIKYRFSPEIIEALLRIKWWDWSLDKIHDNFKYFNDVEKFIALHDRS